MKSQFNSGTKKSERMSSRGIATYQDKSSKSPNYELITGWNKCLGTFRKTATNEKRPAQRHQKPKRTSECQMTTNNN